MTYARARLWLGISGVGFFVVASVAALYFDIARRMLAGKSSVVAISLTLGLYLVLSSPGDVLGGYLLPRRYRRSSQSQGQFLRSWLQGVLVQSLIMGICALLILQVASRAGTLAGIGVFLLLMLVLLAFQLAIATVVGNLSETDSDVALPSDVLYYRSFDPGFIGGLTGFPGREQVVLPSAWVEKLPEEIVAMQKTRRLGAIATGARARGVVLGLGWNLIGFAIASQLPRASLTSAVGLINTALWFTLWSFAGLLLLPSLNRPGVLEVDRFAFEQGVSVGVLERGIVVLDRLQDDEPERARWVERVFHPIPSVRSRLEAIQSGSSARGAWQGARVTLYLSWAGLSLLSRAVHCNVGRPELWVLFPGD